MNSNPYLDEVLKIHKTKDEKNLFDSPNRSMPQSFNQRDEMVYKYSWAIPNENALKTIQKYAPIVEIGAGGGYWAHLLQKRGVEIHVYDNMDDNYLTSRFNKQKRTEWIKVKKGGTSVLKKYSSKYALFLCWPPMSSMASDCLQNFKGNTVIFLGESEWGCTGDDDFHHILGRDYDEIEHQEIPIWWGLHDSLYVYRKKTKA